MCVTLLNASSKTATTWSGHCLAHHYRLVSSQRWRLAVLGNILISDWLGKGTTRSRTRPCAGAFLPGIACRDALSATRKPLAGGMALPPELSAPLPGVGGRIPPDDPCVAPQSPPTFVVTSELTSRVPPGRGGRKRPRQRPVVTGCGLQRIRIFPLEPNKKFDVRYLHI